MALTANTRSNFAEDIKKITANALHQSTVNIHFVPQALCANCPLCIITYPMADTFIDNISKFHFEEGEYTEVTSLLTYPAGDTSIMLVIGKLVVAK